MVRMFKMSLEELLIRYAAWERDFRRVEGRVGNASPFNVYKYLVLGWRKLVFDSIDTSA